VLLAGHVPGAAFAQSFLQTRNPVNVLLFSSENSGRRSQGNRTRAARGNRINAVMTSDKAGDIRRDWDSDNLLFQKRNAFKPWKHHARRHKLDICRAPGPAKSHA
jgi:hypothetical protein